MTSTQGIDVLHGFIDESNELLQNIEGIFIQLERDPGNPEIIDRIFRPVHSLKGNSGFFGLTNINKFSHRLENLLELIRQDEIAVTEKIIDTLLTGVDFLKNMLERAYEDPEDTTLRPEEETFLKNKVDTCVPAINRGTIQTVFDLLHLLEQAVDQGVNIRNISMIKNILDQIETSYEGIKDLLERKKGFTGSNLYCSETEYVYAEKDCTGLLKPFGVVLEALKHHRPVTGKPLTAFLNALDNIEKLLKDKKGLSDTFNKLRSMANFFDDDMLISSSEFYNSMIPLTNDIVSYFIKDKDSDKTEVVQKVGEILITKKKINAFDLSQALAKQKKVGEILIAEGMVNEKDLDDALNEQVKQLLKSRSKEKMAREKTIRIDQYKLDEFADSVGELFINLDAFSFLKSRMERARTDFDILSKFANTVSSMDDRVSKLQEDIMDIRKVPVRNLFQRFPRIIRQLAISLEKKIDFRITGEDTVIDKDLLEKLENPLVHILRNAVDHGIESPKYRENQGKEPEGTITIKSWVDAYFVYITITDDGQGIDPDKIKKVAREKGIFTDIEIVNLSDNELINLVFRPGFSTAETVSDVSGRGVGMDVVLASIKACNGTVEMDSEYGKGSCVKIKVPLTKTLVTKDALIIESSGQLFAIPSDEITTTIYVDDIKIGSVLAQDKIITYKGAIHKVESINKFYYQKDNVHKNGYDHVLVICSRHHIALMVDRILNHQKIVVKNFPKSLKVFDRIPGIGGYTLLGNEDIVLIVDIDEIVKSLSSDSDMQNCQHRLQDIL